MGSHGTVPWKKGDHDDDGASPVPTNVWGKYKDLWGGNSWSPVLLDQDLLPRHLWKHTQPSGHQGKNMFVETIQEIGSCPVRHLQSMGGQGPNMGLAVFMAVWTSGAVHCRHVKQGSAENCTAEWNSFFATMRIWNSLRLGPIFRLGEKVLC